MPSAAVFCSRYLAYSQTFIYEEIRRHRRYDVEVFCRSRLDEERFPFEPVHEGGELYAYTRYSRAFVRRFESTGFDVVHAHFATVGVSAMYYAQRFDTPLLVTFHGWEVPLLTHRRRWLPRHWGYTLLARRMLERMTLGLCASEELLELLVDAGVPRSRLRLHHIGVDVDRFKKGDRNPASPRVLMVGRFVEKKGFEYGVRAFHAAAAGGPARLTIVGGGEREAPIRSLVAELGIADQVDFPGVLGNDEVAELLAQCDVLLAPSVVAADGNRESGLIAVKEAGASESVAIGTRHGGIPEIIEDRSTGYLVPERDVDAMSERLRELLGDSALRQKMGAAAREKMLREYDNLVRVDVLESFYDEARALQG